MSRKKTKGQIKLEGYFKELLKKQDFQDSIEKLRNIYWDDKFTSSESLRMRYWDEVYSLCKRYNLRPYPWREIVDEYVRKGEEANPEFGVRFDMCTIRSFMIEDGASEEDIKHYNEQYPLAICLSPYATIEDIKDFLNNQRDLIRSLLESHQESENIIKHYKRRNKAVAARDDFIFENRDKPRTKIVSLVSDKYGDVLGYDDVGKIIQREKKRRGIKK